LNWFLFKKKSRATLPMSASHELHSLEDKATTLTLNNSSSSTAEADQWLRDNGKSSFY
jgi:hypothetical protein